MHILEKLHLVPILCEKCVFVSRARCCVWGQSTYALDDDGEVIRTPQPGVCRHGSSGRDSKCNKESALAQDRVVKTRR